MSYNDCVKGQKLREENNELGGSRHEDMGVSKVRGNFFGMPILIFFF